MKQQATSGFSLVEMSVVLAVVALLLGGILAGQSLVRAAGLRSVSADMMQYIGAINTFRDKYMALPGDLTNATKYWDIRYGSTGSDVACHQQPNIYTGTCNGDGNGQIGAISGDTSAGEKFAMWQHLAYAKLISGKFTGASGASSSEVRSPGVNLPKSKLGTAFYHIAFLGGPISGNADVYDGPYQRHYLFFEGTPKPLQPDEAWNIDVKLDDGKPASGGLLAAKKSSSWMPNCTTGDTAAAEYAVGTNGYICYFFMKAR